ncbi:MAG: hypothetical protein M0R76_08940 [Proteobacteria bacterium]|nr:hypothetical protein [Pseudomonadota bacterium]
MNKHLRIWAWLLSAALLMAVSCGSDDDDKKGDVDTNNDDKSSDDKSSDDKSSDDKSSDDKGSDDKGSDDKGSDDKGSDDKGTDDDTETENGDTETENGDTESDSEPVAQDVGDDVGDPCACTAKTCFNNLIPTDPVPVPNGGPIVGCGNLPTDHPGAEVVCARSYNGNLSSHIWFANGYCALQATSCDGSSTICNAAEYGDFDAMTTCPTGQVMLENEIEISALIFSAKLKTKTCVKPCTDDADCRIGEHDPVWDAPGEYACVEKDGIGFCYDARNLPDDYDVTQY